MMTNRRTILLIFIVSIFALALLAYQRVGQEITFDTDDIRFTDHYRLSATHEGSLVAVASSVELTADTHVDGDAAFVSNGVVTISGQVDGSLTVMSTELHLTQNAQVDGNLAFMGDKLTLDGGVDGDLTIIADAYTRGETASVSGQSTICYSQPGTTDVSPASNCADQAFKQFIPLQTIAGQNDLTRGQGFTVADLLFSFTVSLLLTGLSALAVTVFPHRFSHIQEAIVTTPSRLAALGCMVGLLAVGVGTAFSLLSAALPVLSFILVPLGLMLTLALLLVSVVGWIALALILGNLLVSRFARAPQPPMMTVIVGSLVLFAVWHVLALLPLGWVVGLLSMALLGTAGLGGALATRLGSRPLRPRYFVQG